MQLFFPQKWTCRFSELTSDLLNQNLLGLAWEYLFHQVHQVLLLHAKVWQHCSQVVFFFFQSFLEPRVYLEWNIQGQQQELLSMDQGWVGTDFQLADHVNEKLCDCTQASRVVKQISRRLPGSHLPQLPHIFQPQALGSRSSGGGAGSLARGSLAFRERELFT